MIPQRPWRMLAQMTFHRLDSYSAARLLAGAVLFAARRLPLHSQVPRRCPASRSRPRPPRARAKRNSARFRPSRSGPPTLPPSSRPRSTPSARTAASSISCCSARLPTIRAVEDRIAAAEKRLGGLSGNEDTIRRSLGSRRAVIAEVLAALQRLGRHPPPALLVQPGRCPAIGARCHFVGRRAARHEDRGRHAGRRSCRTCESPPRNCVRTRDARS